MHMIGNCNFFTMLLIFHCSLQLVLDQVKITQDHRISKSFLSSTIKAQSLFWRSSLNQSLHASIDSREIWKKMCILVLNMKDFLHCLYAAHLTDHHVLVVKMTTKHLGSITSWALYLYTNLKHISEQWLHQRFKALHDQMSLPPLLSWLKAHLVHFSGKEFINNRMVEAVKMRTKACLSNLRSIFPPEVMCIFPSKWTPCLGHRAGCHTW